MFLLGFFNNLFEGPSGLIILLLVVLLFGAKRIPELARSLGTAVNEFNKAKNEVQQQLSQAQQPQPPAAAQPQEPLPQSAQAPQTTASTEPQEQPKA